MNGGGAERVAADLMNRLSDRFEVTAILLEEEQPDDYPLLPAVRRMVVPAGRSKWYTAARLSGMPE